MESISETQNTGSEVIEKNEKKKSRFIIDSIEVAFFFVTSILLVFTFFFSVVAIDGPSMENTLHDKDRVIVRKLFYKPEDYDIVIIKCENANLLDSDGNVVTIDSPLDENIVKRVIATAGQTIDIDFEQGIVYVDGVEAESDFTKEPTYLNLEGFSYPLTVPEGYVFVMGDNRNNSLDSRSSEVGLVDTDDILGKVVLRVAPFSSFGRLD